MNSARICLDCGSRSTSLMPIPEGRELRLDPGLDHTTMPLTSKRWAMPGRVKRSRTLRFSGSGCGVRTKIPPPLMFREYADRNSCAVRYRTSTSTSTLESSRRSGISVCPPGFWPDAP